MILNTIKYEKETQRYQNILLPKNAQRRKASKNMQNIYSKNNKKDRVSPVFVYSTALYCVPNALIILIKEALRKPIKERYKQISMIYRHQQFLRGSSWILLMVYIWYIYLS